MKHDSFEEERRYIGYPSLQREGPHRKTNSVRMMTLCQTIRFPQVLCRAQLGKMGRNNSQVVFDVGLTRSPTFQSHGPNKRQLLLQKVRLADG